MTAKKSGASPDEQRRYDEAHGAEAPRRALAMRGASAGFVVHADQANQHPTSRPSFEAIFTQQRQPTGALRPHFLFHMPFTLATATPADAPRLTALVNRAYRGDASRQGWTTEAHLLDGQRIDEAGIREMLAVPEAALLLCLGENDELRGSFYAHPTGGNLYLSMLAVAPTGQAQGVGKFLIRAAEDHGRRHGCTLSKMTVISVRPELIAYYERQGYRLTGATEPFPTDPRYGVPKQPLELLVLQKPLG